MNEVIIVTHPGDNISSLVKTAMEIVKIESVNRALIDDFNGVKLFVMKNSTYDELIEEYFAKL